MVSDRLKRFSKVNTEIADWLQVRLSLPPLPFRNPRGLVAPQEEEYSPTCPQGQQNAYMNE